MRRGVGRVDGRRERGSGDGSRDKSERGMLVQKRARAAEGSLQCQQRYKSMLALYIETTELLDSSLCRRCCGDCEIDFSQAKRAAPLTLANHLVT